MQIDKNVTQEQIREYRKILDKLFTIHMYVGFAFVIIYRNSKDIAHIPINQSKTYDEAEKEGVLYTINHLLKDDFIT